VCENCSCADCVAERDAYGAYVRSLDAAGQKREFDRLMAGASRLSFLDQLPKSPTGEMVSIKLISDLTP